jgi:hypothetical protein
MSKGIISPLINYMTENEMICDATSPVSYYQKTAQIDFTTAGGALPTSLAINKPYYFKPDNTLDHQNGDIKAIEVVSPTVQNTFENGVSNLSSDDVFGNVLLYLVDGNDNILVQTPLTSLLGISYGGYALKLYRTKLSNVIWQKCYIEILDTTAISAGEGIKFKVYYDKKNRK